MKRFMSDGYAYIRKIYKPARSGCEIRFVVYYNDEYVGAFTTYTDAEIYICEYLFGKDTNSNG